MSPTDDLELPVDTETERLCLSALILCEQPGRDEYAMRIVPSWFYDEWHRKLFETIQQARRLKDAAFLEYVQRQTRDNNPDHWFEWMSILLIGRPLGPTHVPVESWMEFAVVRSGNRSGEPADIPIYAAKLGKFAGYRRKIESALSVITETQNEFNSDQVL